MATKRYKEQGLRSTDIILDIRQCVIHESEIGEKTTLAEYYQLIGDSNYYPRIGDSTNERRISGDRAKDSVQDAVRQLVDARKNSKAGGQIQCCKATLKNALNDTLLFCGSQLLAGGGVEKAVEAIDTAIVQSMAVRYINCAASR